MVWPTSSSTPMAMVASQAIVCDDVAADQAVSLELAGQVGRLAGARRRERPGARGRRRSTGSPSWPGQARRRCDERIISTKASQRRWSHGVSPSDGTGAPGPRGRSGSRRRTREVAGRSWCGTASLKRKKRRSCSERPAGGRGIAPSSGRCRRVGGRCTPRAWSPELLLGLGRGHVGHGAHLVKGEVARAERLDQVGHVPGLLADACVAPVPSASRPRSARRPRARSTSLRRRGTPGAGRPRRARRRWPLRWPPSDGRAGRDSRRSPRSSGPPRQRSRPHGRGCVGLDHR